jgi:hypothetical protein
MVVRASLCVLSVVETWVRSTAVADALASIWSLPWTHYFPFSLHFSLIFLTLEDNTETMMKLTSLLLAFLALFNVAMSYRMNSPYYAVDRLGEFLLVFFMVFCTEK